MKLELERVETCAGEWNPMPVIVVFVIPVVTGLIAAGVVVRRIAKTLRSRRAAVRGRDPPSAMNGASSDDCTAAERSGGVLPPQPPTAEIEIAQARTELPRRDEGTAGSTFIERPREPPQRRWI